MNQADSADGSRRRMRGLSAGGRAEATGNSRRVRQPHTTAGAPPSCLRRFGSRATLTRQARWPPGGDLALASSTATGACSRRPCGALVRLRTQGFCTSGLSKMQPHPVVADAFGPVIPLTRASTTSCPSRYMAKASVGGSGNEGEQFTPGRRPGDAGEHGDRDIRRDLPALIPVLDEESTSGL